MPDSIPTELDQPSPHPRRILRGLLVRKERWGLSWSGRLVLTSITLLIGGLLFRNVHSFLAVTHREESNVLVVEGWVHVYGVVAAVDEFKTGRDGRVFTTGGPVEGMGTSRSIYDTDAYQSARLLREAGIPGERVQCVPSLFISRDRTYNSALALRNWFHDHNLQIHSFNVLTEDAHARRTWLLYEEAFGKSAHIGIISVPNPDYDASHWWRTSEGVRNVVDEGIAYIYAKFFFWPKSS